MQNKIANILLTLQTAYR